MNKFLLLIISIAITQVSIAQNDSAYKEGEWFKFKMSYSGFFKAGEATMSVSESTYKGKPVYHIVGKGKTTGAIKWFFKVRDKYESYIDKTSGLPYRFIRNINEGGHKKNVEIEFDHTANKAYVNDKKRKKKSTVDTNENVQDLVSAFYYLRNNYDMSTIKPGDYVMLNMFFDKENFPFKLKFLGKEVLKTKFGKINTLKFRPYVMAGRVFKESESLTLWVSADKNKMPLRIKADLSVGSLRADLEAFKGLKHPFNIIMN
jgi:hypothetical protein